MKLTLNRDIRKENFTLGKLSIDGEFFCYTVEDAVRENKIPKITAIPAGIYKVIIDMSARFKKLLPLLLNVPNYQGVRIHSGNTAEDTEGCIIVGFTRTENGVAQSRDAMTKLFMVLKTALDIGQEITIEIINE